MSEPLPRAKDWRHRRLISEPASDKLRAIDCTFAEFENALEVAEIIEEHTSSENAKQVLLTMAWRRPLHVVVMVDQRRAEERIVTVYEPEPSQWSSDCRRRR